MLILGPRPDGDLVARGVHVREAGVAHPALELGAGARVALEVARGLQEGGDPSGDGDYISIKKKKIILHGISLHQSPEQQQQE